jgi:spermidine synthase
MNRFIVNVMCFLQSGLFATVEWFEESLFDSWRQSFHIQEKLYEEMTEQQNLLLFRNAFFGEVLALDGVIQTTQKDEFIYHEMLTHVPLLAHGNARTILVIGGGDGGILREILKHQVVEKVVLVEIDPSVIEFSKIYLPHLSDGAFYDLRVQIVIQDAAEFIKECSERFDVIICDSPDPEGPGHVLFTEGFYGDCKKRLKPQGVFVNQSGVPFLQEDELLMVYKGLSRHFADVKFYLAAVPTYVGGCMAFGWATDHEEGVKPTKHELDMRLKGVKGDLRYYTPAMHKAAFALPRYIEELLKRASD